MPERINELLNQYKIPIALSLVGLVLIIGGIFSSGLFKHTSQKISYPQESIVQAANTASIKVDISGAVVSPGVYSASSTDRIEDLIKKAGGFLDIANHEYISKNLNLAQKIVDGQKVYIPFANEKIPVGGQVAGISTSISSSSSSKIGLNSATQAQLEELPSVGAVTAQKIISKRPYQSIDELLIKKALGKATFEKVKDLVDLN